MHPRTPVPAAGPHLENSGRRTHVPPREKLRPVSPHGMSEIREREGERENARRVRIFIVPRSDPGHRAHSVFVGVHVPSERRHSHRRHRHHHRNSEEEGGDPEIDRPSKSPRSLLDGQNCHRLHVMSRRKSHEVSPNVCFAEKCVPFRLPRQGRFRKARWVISARLLPRTLKTRPCRAF